MLTEQIALASRCNPSWLHQDATNCIMCGLGVWSAGVWCAGVWWWKVVGWGWGCEGGGGAVATLCGVRCARRVVRCARPRARACPNFFFEYMCFCALIHAISCVSDMWALLAIIFTNMIHLVNSCIYTLFIKRGVTYQTGWTGVSLHSQGAAQAFQTCIQIITNQYSRKVMTFCVFLIQQGCFRNKTCVY